MLIGMSMINLGEVMTTLQLHRQGLSISAISVRLNMDRKTVRKYILTAFKRHAMVRVYPGLV